MDSEKKAYIASELTKALEETERDPNLTNEIRENQRKQRDTTDGPELDRHYNLVEKAILEAPDYPTADQLWEQFSSTMSRLQLDDALAQLYFDNKIMRDDHQHIIYVGVNNPVLQKLVDESVPLR